MVYVTLERLSEDYGRGPPGSTVDPLFGRGPPGKTVEPLFFETNASAAYEIAMFVKPARRSVIMTARNLLNVFITTSTWFRYV
jgi:hypothetical protein